MKFKNDVKIKTQDENSNLDNSSNTGENAISNVSVTGWLLGFMAGQLSLDHFMPKMIFTLICIVSIYLINK